jgi:hypothetical protein
VIFLVRCEGINQRSKMNDTLFGEGGAKRPITVYIHFWPWNLFIVDADLTERTDISFSYH